MSDNLVQLPKDDHLASDPGRAELSGKRKISQLLDLQADLYWSQLKAKDPRDKAALACAWERLENRLGRLQMRPEPKPVEVGVVRRGRGFGRLLSVSAEPVPAEADDVAPDVAPAPVPTHPSDDSGAKASTT